MFVRWLSHGGYVGMRLAGPALCEGRAYGKIGEVTIHSAREVLRPNNKKQIAKSNPRDLNLARIENMKMAATKRTTRSQENGKKERMRT